MLKTKLASGILPCLTIKRHFRLNAAEGRKIPRRSSQLNTQPMQLRKESLEKIQPCQDSNPDLCDTGEEL